MLGYLLARAGVDVTVLEKHKDFFRDFRGDTVHPSTMQLMKQLGLLDEFLKQPHQRVDAIYGAFGNYSFELASLRNLKIDTPFIALMPQWDFLNFLSGKARKYPEFKLRMENEAIGLIQDQNKIRGVVVKTPDGEQKIEADLVVACDGRNSIMRDKASLPVQEIGVPIDVLWFRISHPENDPIEHVMGNINYGKMLVLIERDNYFQAGLIIQKGSFNKIQQDGIDAFRRSLTQIVPELGNRTSEIRDWNDVKLLSVQINRLRKWSRPGLLCIGDAAHAMSPVFGVGINLAIQDAVAAANQLATPLGNKQSTDALLEAVQKRREFPTKGTQLAQEMVHKALSKIFRHHGPMQPPLMLRVVVHIPGLRTFIARAVGMGLRPECIQTPDVHAPHSGTASWPPRTN
jgi:2-polyprenyl-6-methoxyphenol hydroxylase-like FAD-dependent oxidoreductase